MQMSRMKVILFIHHKKLAFVTCMHLTYCRQLRQKPLSSSTRCHSLNEESKRFEKKTTTKQSKVCAGSWDAVRRAADSFNFSFSLCSVGAQMNCCTF